MKHFIVLLVAVCICNVLGKVPPPEPAVDKDGKASAVSRVSF